MKKKNEWLLDCARDFRMGLVMGLGWLLGVSMVTEFQIIVGS